MYNFSLLELLGNKNCKIAYSIGAISKHFMYFWITARWTFLGRKFNFLYFSQQFNFHFCKLSLGLQQNMLALFTAKSLINEGLLVYCIFEKSLVVARRRISSFVRWQNVCCDWRIMNGFGNFRAVRGKSYGEQQIYKFTLLQQTFMSPMDSASFFIFSCEHEMYAFYSECMTMQLHVE